MDALIANKLELQLEMAAMQETLQLQATGLSCQTQTVAELVQTVAELVSQKLDLQQQLAAQ